MPDSSDHLVRFVRAVHRRLVVVRAGERAGVCVGVAAGFSLVLALGMWWEGRDALGAVGIVLGLGGVIGLAWGLARRPGMMDAAVEADRQLGLADLLGTALASLRSEDPWARSVVAVAEARVRTLSPGAVVLRRYGGRAWGGIGLSAALVLTLGVMSSVLQRSDAAGQATPGAPRLALPAGAPEEQSDAMVQRGGGGRLDNLADAAGHPAEMGKKSALATPGGMTADAHGRAPMDAPGRAGEGAGSAALDGSRGEAVPTVQGEASNSLGKEAAEAGSAGGRGRSDAPAGGSTSPDGLAGGGTAAVETSRPWESAQWRGDRAEAEEAVRSGRVPDSYRNVLSAYFGPGRD